MSEDRAKRIRRFQEESAAAEARFQAWTREREEQAERYPGG